MTTVSMTAARHGFTDVANQVIFHGERVFVSKSNKPAFAFVPIDDVRLLELLEDKIDLDAAKEALASDDFVSWEKVKKQLGL